MTIFEFPNYFVLSTSSHLKQPCYANKKIG